MVRHVHDSAFWVLRMNFIILSIEIYLGNRVPILVFNQKKPQLQTSAADKEAFGKICGNKTVFSLF